MTMEANSRRRCCLGFCAPRCVVLVAAIFLRLGLGGALGQPLRLEACHALIDSGYPLVRQVALIRQAADDHRRSSLMSYVPQVSLGGKVTYQSDVTRVALDAFNFPFAFTSDFPTPRKDQYQVYADINQVIWDGGYKRSQSRIVQAESEVGVQQVRVELERLHAQIDDLYFTLLLLDKRIQVHTLLETELDRQLGRVRAYVANGVASSSDLGLVEVERHRAAQGRVQLESARRSAVLALEALLGIPVSGRELAVPDVPAAARGVGRSYGSPALDLLHAQERLAGEHVKSVTVKLYPTLFLFFRGGFGNPGLNMLEDKFRWYYYAGVQFAWNFGSLYDYKQMQRSTTLQQRSRRLGAEALQRSLQARGDSQRALLEQYDRMLAEDEQIIALRKQIASTKEAQVENGTATVLELLEAVREMQVAEQDRAVHEMERLKAAYQLSRMLEQGTDN